VFADKAAHQIAHGRLVVDHQYRTGAPCACLGQVVARFQLVEQPEFSIAMTGIS
jgi:hypothetical protein